MPPAKKENQREKVADIKALETELEFRRKLNDITNKLNTYENFDDILINLRESYLRESILNLFEADRLTIYVVDSAKKEIFSRFKTGEEISEIRVPINNKSLAGYCAAVGRILNIVNAYDKDELRRINPALTFDESWDERTGYKTKQVLVAPIKFSKYLLGVIQFINKLEGNRFTLEDQKSVIEIQITAAEAEYGNNPAPGT